MTESFNPGGGPARLLREVLAPVEIARFLLSAGVMGTGEPGDGHAVLLIPGFGAGEEAMRPLGRAIERLGYRVYGWGQGRNLGMRPRLRDNLRRLMKDLYERHHGPVSLIGWSLGGVFARELARESPERVRRLFTLGSPINGYPIANDLAGQVRLMLSGKLLRPDEAAFRLRSIPPPVPCTAFHSKVDGFVDWRACLEPFAANTENIEVRSSHIGLVYNLDVFRAIAQRLAAQPAAAGASR